MVGTYYVRIECIPWGCIAHACEEGPVFVFRGETYYPRQATKESIARVTEAQARTNNARAYPLTAKSIETVRIWLVSFAQLSIPSWLTRENGLGPAFLRVRHVHAHTSFFRYTHARNEIEFRTSFIPSCILRPPVFRAPVSMNQC